MLSIYEYMELASFQVELAKKFFKDGRPLDLEGKLTAQGISYGFILI